MHDTRNTSGKALPGSYAVVAAIVALFAGGLLVLWALRHDAKPAPKTATTPQEPRFDLTRPQVAPARTAASRRQSLLAAIEKTRSLRRAQAAAPAEQPGEARPSGRPSDPAEGADDTPLSTDYLKKVKDTVMAARPLLRQCVDSARVRDPSMSANDLWLQVTLAAEKGVAGLVEDAKISEGAFAKDAALLECLHETLYAMEFPPPEAGGSTAIAFPLNPPKQPPKVIRED